MNRLQSRCFVTLFLIIIPSFHGIDGQQIRFTEHKFIGCSENPFMEHNIVEIKGQAVFNEQSDLTKLIMIDTVDASDNKEPLCVMDVTSSQQEKDCQYHVTSQNGFYNFSVSLFASDVSNKTKLLAYLIYKNSTKIVDEFTLSQLPADTNIGLASLEINNERVDQNCSRTLAGGNFQLAAQCQRSLPFCELQLSINGIVLMTETKGSLTYQHNYPHGVALSLGLSINTCNREKFEQIYSCDLNFVTAELHEIPPIANSNGSVTGIVVGVVMGIVLIIVIIVVIIILYRKNIIHFPCQSKIVDVELPKEKSYNENGPETQLLINENYDVTYLPDTKSLEKKVDMKMYLPSVPKNADDKEKLLEAEEKPKIADVGNAVEVEVHNVSPVDYKVSPADHNVSPADQNVNPADQNVNPADQNVNPADQNVSPADHNVNPADHNVSSADYNVNPADHVSSADLNEVVPVEEKVDQDEANNNQANGDDVDEDLAGFETKLIGKDETSSSSDSFDSYTDGSDSDTDKNIHLSEINKLGNSPGIVPSDIMTIGHLSTNGRKS